MWRDRQFIAALLAAPIFWALWWRIDSPQFDPAWPLHAPFRFLLPALIYPVLEELAFRGLLQEWLYRKRWGRLRTGPVSVANWLTTALFVLAHFVHHPPAWAIAVAFPSLVFGYFRDRYQSIMPAITLHVFYNTGFIWLFAR